MYMRPIWLMVSSFSTSVYFSSTFCVTTFSCARCNGNKLIFQRAAGILPKSHDSYRLPLADTQLHFVRPHCSPCEKELAVELKWLDYEMRSNEFCHQRDRPFQLNIFAKLQVAFVLLCQLLNQLELLVRDLLERLLWAGRWISHENALQNQQPTVTFVRQFFSCSSFFWRIQTCARR